MYLLFYVWSNNIWYFIGMSLRDGELYIPRIITNAINSNVKPKTESLKNNLETFIRGKNNQFQLKGK